MMKEYNIRLFAVAFALIVPVGGCNMASEPPKTIDTQSSAGKVPTPTTSNAATPTPAPGR